MLTHFSKKSQKYPALLEIVPSSQFIEVSGQRIEERG